MNNVDMVETRQKGRLDWGLGCLFCDCNVKLIY